MSETNALAYVAPTDIDQEKKLFTQIVSKMVEYVRDKCSSLLTKKKSCIPLTPCQKEYSMSETNTLAPQTLTKKKQY